MELLDAVLQADQAEAEARLYGWGLRRPASAYAILRQLLASLTPPEFGLLHEALARAMPDNPDPDRALANLERFNQAAGGPLRPVALASERPYVFDVLLDLFGFSQFMSDVIIRYPHYVAWLADPRTLDEDVSADGLAVNLRQAISPTEAPEFRQRAAIRWLRRALLRAGSRERMALIRDSPRTAKERELLGFAHEGQFMRELSEIANAAIRVALEESWTKLSMRFGRPIEEDPEGSGRGREAQFCVVAMGKLGGLELNFSSDVDLIFLYSAEGQTSGRESERGLPPEGRITNHDFFCRLSEAILQFLSYVTDEGYLYRVDTRLRPDGSEGPLARSLAAFEIYHETQARPWERLALIKGAAVAGGAELCVAFDRMSRALVFDREAGPELVGQIAELKRKIDMSVETGKEKGREIKRGHGGIREIEFFVQTLQLLHGAGTPAVQSRSTLDALAGLADRGKLPTERARQLHDDYLTLRRIEHRLQMMDLRQTHTLPDDPEELDSLAQRCGIGPEEGSAAGKTPGEALTAMWEEISRRVHAQFVEFFGDAAETASADSTEGSPAVKAADAVLARAPDRELIPLLAPYGLESGGAIGSLKRMAGLGGAHYLDGRGRELYLRVVPALIESAAASARPAATLGSLESFLVSSSSIAGMYEVFAADPGLPALLLRAFGAADSWAKTLISHPEYLDYLLDRGFIAAGSSAEQLTARLRRWSMDAGGGRLGLPPGLARLRRFESLLTGLADIGEMISFSETTRRLSEIAEIGIEEALRSALAEGNAAAESVDGIAVLGMGKLGTRELNYFSDLDIIYCWDNRTGPRNVEEIATPAAELVTQLLTEVTDEGAPFSVDARLRPEGQNAPLAPPISRYREYYAERAELWEMQSFMKVRHVAGDSAVSRRFIAEAGEVIARRVKEMQKGDAIRPLMLDMRRRMEQSVKTPKWVLCDFKKGPGGTVDLEFLAQYFQLLHFAEDASLIGLPADAVFSKMGETGALDREEAAAMQDDYLFLRRFESRTRLLFETERSHAPAGGEKWESLRRLCADLVNSGEDLRERLLLTLRRNRQRFGRILG